MAVNMTTVLIEQINAYAEAGRWFWVAGLARETWSALLPVIDQLHDVAADAVQHYAALAPPHAQRNTP